MKFIFDLLKGALKLPTVILGSPLPVSPLQIVIQLATAIWQCLTNLGRFVFVLLVLIGSWVFSEQLAAELMLYLEPYLSLSAEGGLFIILYVWLAGSGIFIGSRFDSLEKFMFVLWWSGFASVVLIGYSLFLLLFSNEV